MATTEIYPHLHPLSLHDALPIYGRGGLRITGGEVLLDGEDILALGSGIRSIRGNRVCYVAQSAAAACHPAHRLGDQVVEAAVRHGKLPRAKPPEDRESTPPNSRHSCASPLLTSACQQTTILLNTNTD